MSAENRALAPLLKRKRHSIPLGVRYWAFFKQCVLEKKEVREEFGAAELSLEQFKHKMKRFLHGAPSRGRRRGKRTQQRLNRDMLVILYEYYRALLDGARVPWEIKDTEYGGLGLCAKEDFIWSVEHSKRLFGIVSGVDEDEFSVLSENKYPSLFNSRGAGRGILFGPASLGNHACNSSMRWSDPTRRGTPELFEGFRALRIKHSRRAVVRFKQGDEISVLYGMHRKNFTCTCPKCSTK